MKKQNPMCRCGHLHDQHGQTRSINYSAGECNIKGCQCQNFLHDMENKIPTPIDFAKWLNNNWFKPSGIPNNWILKRVPSDCLSKDKTFTTEQLFDKFLKEY